MSSRYPRVSIPGTEMRRIKSSYVDQGYSILVGLPESYDDTDETYPVVYVTDGNCYSGTVLETVRMGAYGGELPEVIVVGIGYPVRTISET